MNNSLYLKKIDETIDYSIRKRSNTFNLEYLVNYVINKININTTNENDTNELENILISQGMRGILLWLGKHFMIILTLLFKKKSLIQEFNISFLKQIMIGL